MTSTLEFLILAKDQASETFKNIGDSVDKNASKFDKFQGAANVAFTAIGAGLVMFAKSSIDAYGDAAEQQSKLELAYQKFPALAGTNIESLRALNTELQKKTGFDGDATAAAQASLAAYGLTGDQIAKMTPLMADYAAKTGTDMQTAAEVMGKAMLGSGKALKGVGIDFVDAGSVGANFDQVMSGLSTTVGGTAEMMGGTASGKAKILKESWGDLQEMAGEKLMPAMNWLVEKGTALTQWMTEHSTATAVLAGGVGVLTGALMLAANWSTILAIREGIAGMATAVHSGITKAAAAAQWLMNAALSANPIGLIIIAIAALVAGILWLWNNNEGFRNFVIAAWDAIKKAFVAVVDWVVNVMVPWLKQAFENIAHVVGVVVDWILDKWNAYWRGMSIIAGWIGDAVNGIVGFFTSMPGKIAAAAGGMWDGIVSAFKAAINTLIRMWNNFQLTIGGGNILGIDIPSVTLNTPDIPYLATGGTLARGGAAVVGERGAELVTMPTGATVTANGAPVSLTPDTLNALGEVITTMILGAIGQDKWTSSMGRVAPARGR